MARVPEIDPDNLSDTQQAIYDRIAGGPRGKVRGPYHAWFQNPGYCDCIEQMGRFLRYEGSIPGNLRELAIITVARHWHAEFEWFAHAPIAAREGVAEEAIAAIAKGDTPAFGREDEALVYAFTCELLDDKGVSDTTFGKAVELLTLPGAVELTGLIGHYTSVAMALNTFRIELPEGEPRPF